MLKLPRFFSPVFTVIALAAFGTGVQPEPAQALHPLASAGASIPVCVATRDSITLFASINGDAVQTAINAASPGETIKIAGTCAGTTSGGPIARIDKSLTLTGGYTSTNWITPDPVANPTILDALGLSRVISASVAASLSGFTVTNGAVAGNGGGILSAGPITLTNMVIYSNTALGATSDGGAAWTNGATTVIGSRFISNTAGRDAGGVYVRSDIGGQVATITGSLFQNNQAKHECGGLCMALPSTISGTQFLSNTTQVSNGGGAVFYLDTSIINSDFSYNSAASNGGGVQFNGTGFSTVTGTRFAHNFAQVAGGGAEFRASGQVTVTASSFIANTADFFEIDGTGGGVSLKNSSSATFINVLFAGNNAIVGGVAIESITLGPSVTLVHTTIASPTLASGSAIRVGNTLIMTNTLIANHAVGIEKTGTSAIEDYTMYSGVGTPVSGTVTGGGHSFNGAAGFADPAAVDYRLSIASDAINRGVATSVSADAFGNVRPQGAAPDIGYHESSLGNYCFAQANNTAVFSTTSAGAVRSAVAAAAPGSTIKLAGYCAGAMQDAGTSQLALITKTLSLVGGYTSTNWITPNPANVTTLDALGGGRVFLASAAASLQGFTLTNGATTGEGGGVYGSDLITLTKMGVTNNLAGGSGGGVRAPVGIVISASNFISNTGLYGGGAHTDGRLLTRAGTFERNNATHCGAVRDGTGWLDTGSTFNQNAATAGNGGAACVSDYSVLTSTRFISNQAAFSGGGMFAGANVMLKGVQLTGNVAGSQGGGAIVGANAIISGSQFTNNQAGQEGGGAYLGAGAIIAGSQISGNVAGASGGGMLLGDNATITTSQFISNISAVQGGGAFLGNAAILSAVLFKGNQATDRGAGAYVGAGAIITGSLFDSNASTAGFGGGAYLGASALVTATTFQYNSAGGGGGAEFQPGAQISASTFTSNTAFGYAGGIYFPNGAASVRASVIAYNRCTACATYGGGGIWSHNTLALDGVQLLHNTANGPGGGLAHGVSISTLATDQLIITNSLMAGNQGTGDGGAAVINTAGSASIVHTTIASATLGTGAAIRVITGSVSLSNTILANYGAGLARENGTVREDYDLYANVAAPYVGTVLAGGHSITGAAGFANPAADDYRLSRASDAINHAVSSTLSIDFFGGPRPQAGAPDIGFAESPYGLACFAQANSLTVYSSTNASALRAAVASALPNSTVRLAGICTGAIDQAGSAQVALIDKALAIAGGYTTTNWITPSTANVTTVDAANAGRGLYATEVASLTGFTVTGGSSTGLGGGVLAYAAMTATNMTFISNTTTSAGGGATFLGKGVLIGSFFIDNTSGDYGGGAAFSDRATVTTTRFIGNQAYGGGGASFSAPAVVVDGKFVNNRATNAPGGGAYFGDDATVSASQFSGNTSRGIGGGAVFQLRALVDSTLFNSNAATATASSGGGSFFYGDTTVNGSWFISNVAGSGAGAFFLLTATVAGSSFMTNTARQDGAGMASFGALDLRRVLIVGNISGGDGGGLIHTPYSPTNGGETLTVTNSLFARNTAAGNGMALAINGGDGARLIHTTIASPTLAAGAAIWAFDGSLWLTNTIIASHTVGIAQALGAVSEDYTLFAGVPTSATGTVWTGAHSRIGAAGFVNPAADNYHLTASSAAIDKGVATAVTVDYDGDSRPAGHAPDIGYDESPFTATARKYVFLSSVRR